jgi:hypothetical protein
VQVPWLSTEPSKPRSLTCSLHSHTGFLFLPLVWPLPASEPRLCWVFPLSLTYTSVHLAKSSWFYRPCALSPESHLWLPKPGQVISFIQLHDIYMSSSWCSPQKYLINYL